MTDTFKGSLGGVDAASVAAQLCFTAGELSIRRASEGLDSVSRPATRDCNIFGPHSQQVGVPLEEVLHSSDHVDPAFCRILLPGAGLVSARLVNAQLRSVGSQDQG